MGRHRRVLITGAAGQVGRELVEAFTEGAGGRAWDIVACDHATLDVADREQTLQVVGAAEPDEIVHAAAWTDVDGCQLDPDRAYQVNALGTRHVAEAARLAGARVTYLSTDYVFDGMAGRPYNEWDSPNPLSVYGHSKLGGEAELGSPADTVVRTSWVCGRYGRNFVKTVLARAAAGQPLRVVDDQFGCPTVAGDLAQMVRRLVAARLPGLFHVTNQGMTSWYQFACDIVSAAGLAANVVPICTGELDPPRPAPRPHHSVLDNAALRLSGMPLLPDHHEPLERLVKELT